MKKIEDFNRDTVREQGLDIILRSFAPNATELDRIQGQVALMILQCCEMQDRVVDGGGSVSFIAGLAGENAPPAVEGEPAYPSTWRDALAAFEEMEQERAAFMAEA